MIETGHIRLSRQFTRHPFWTEERTYSRAEAWLDLITEAAFTDRKKLVSGTMVQIPRGGIVASERFLSDRWMWSRTKVRAFLDLLRTEKMVTTDTEKTTGCTTILLCNYERFNTPKEPPTIPPGDRRGTKGEEGEEGKNDKPERPLATRERPTSEQVRTFERQQVAPHDTGFADWWHDAQEASGWIGKNQIPIADWKAAYRAARSSNRHAAQEAAARKQYPAKPGAASGKMPGRGWDGMTKA